jgi:hypothetical protein
MSNPATERLKIATRVITASGMVRAAAYMANMAEASVGLQCAGSIEAGEISPAIENPPATMTLTAVITDARRMALGEEEGVVIGRGSGMKMDKPHVLQAEATLAPGERQLFCEKCDESEVSWIVRIGQTPSPSHRCVRDP